MTIVAQTHGPKADRNCCVIEVFGGVFGVVILLFGFFNRSISDVFVLCFLDFSVDVGAFVIVLSLISSFFSLY